MKFTFALMVLLVLLFVGCDGDGDPGNEAGPIDTAYVIIDSIEIRDSIVYRFIDSIIVKDSTVYNFIDSVIYSYKDSTVYSFVYSVNNVDLKKLIFGTDTLRDTTIHYIASQSAPDSVWTLFNKNYDSSTQNYFDLKFYFDSSFTKNHNGLNIAKVIYKESGEDDKPEEISAMSDHNLSTSFDFDHGYTITYLTKLSRIDSIKLWHDNEGETIAFFMKDSTGDVVKDKPSFALPEGTLTYVPRLNEGDYINLSTTTGINWKLFEIRVFGEIK